MLEALVRVCARDDLWISAAHVHILLPVEDVTAVTLQAVDWEKTHIIFFRESRSTEPHQNKHCSTSGTQSYIYMLFLLEFTHKISLE